MTLHLSEVRSDFKISPVTQPIAANPQSTHTLYRAHLKRALDITLVILSLPIVLPLIGLCAVLLMFTASRPFYSQPRVGQNGKHFRIWKMRTMVHDADKTLECYLKQNSAARIEWDTTQKLKNDPRITKLGRLLRKTSLDELPQLLNVLNGTMSLVGPRPMLVEQQSQYPSQAYYAMRPGITGLWQVSDRNDCSFAHRAAYDDTYYDNMSLRTDAKILLKTINVVLKATGH